MSKDKKFKVSRIHPSVRNTHIILSNLLEESPDSLIVGWLKDGKWYTAHSNIDLYEFSFLVKCFELDIFSAMRDEIVAIDGEETPGDDDHDGPLDDVY